VNFEKMREEKKKKGKILIHVQMENEEGVSRNIYVKSVKERNECKVEIGV
jgi:hypothetical protein